jgi:release factor glutamine methyltransferase
VNATRLAGPTVDSVRREWTARFKSAGIESAELDARILTGAALGLDLTGLIKAARHPVAETEVAKLEAFARRRLAGEPVARILGQKEFWGLPFRLSTETLVPRPDTETVVELGLEMLRAMPHPPRAARIADIGTGSGAILLALLSELPGAIGVGTDISLAALMTASDNAVELGLASRAGFVACNYAAALSGGFDLIVSNPPYIRTADVAGLAVEVRDHDPRRALDGGADGLGAYRDLIPEAAELLTPGGALVVESGIGQSGDIEGFMIAAGLTITDTPRPDLGGVSRAVGGRKMPR